MLEANNLSDIVLAKKLPPQPIVLFGLYFEGLISFQFARRSKDSAKWTAKGEAILDIFKGCSENCPWNWENKMLILEAERAAILGKDHEAESWYIRSIRSAKEHRFIHEQGIASELAGMFFYERGLHQKASHCYNEWGALAVSKVRGSLLDRLCVSFLYAIPINGVFQPFIPPSELKSSLEGHSVQIFCNSSFRMKQWSPFSYQPNAHRRNGTHLIENFVIISGYVKMV